MKYKSFKKMFLSVVLGMGVAVTSVAVPVCASGVDALGEAVISDVPDTFDESKYPVLRDENGNIYDLGGMEIIVRDWWTDPDAPIDTSTEYGKAKKEYLDWIQKTYNFKIKQQWESSWGYVGQDFIDYVSSGGDDNNYVFTLRDSDVQTGINNNCCYELELLDCLNFSDTKLSKNLVADKYTENGHIYAMYAGDSEPRMGLYFNKRLLKEVGISADEIYDLQKNKQWTWDKWEEMLSKVQRDKDGDGNVDVYGFTCNYTSFPTTVTYSNDSNMVGRENGKYVLNTTSSKTLTALSFTQKVFDEYTILNEMWDSYKDYFVNGEAAFALEEAYLINSNYWLNEMEDDFGFVMFPMGPDAKDYTNCWINNPVAIPACYDYDRAWKIAFAWNLFTDEVPGYENNDEWKKSYDSFTSDQRLINETLAMMRVKGCTEYLGNITGLSSPYVYDFLWMIFPGGTNAAELAKNTKEKFQPYVDEANEKFNNQQTTAGGSGDIDGNGKVNRADRIYFARALAGWSGYSIPSKEVADFTGDNKVNRADRIYLARALANWDGYSLKK